MSPSPLETPAPPLPRDNGGRGEGAMAVRAFLSRSEGLGFVRVCVRRYARTPAEVDDLASAAIVRCLEGAHHYREVAGRGPGGLLGWVGTVARRTAISARRKAGSNERREVSEEAGAWVGEWAATGDPGLRREIARALAVVPEDMLRAWWMYEVEGREQAEVAAALACPVGTVMSRVFRARGKLRVALKNLR